MSGNINLNRTNFAGILAALSDVNLNTPSDQDVLTYDDGTSKWIAQAVAKTFVGLTDTPANYTGSAYKFIRVNSTPDALEFTTESVINHDILFNFVADKHIDWKDASDNFKTTGTATLHGDIYTDRWLENDYNFFMGVGTAGAGNLAHVAGNTGYFNVGIGYNTLHDITTGYQNIAVGARCLENVLAGHSNVGIGTYALFKNDTGYQNMAFGYQALYRNEGGYQNTAIGYGSLFDNVVGSYNVAIGAGALYKNLSSSNIGIGLNAGNQNQNGWANINIGYEAGKLATVPYLNVYIGSQAGWNNFGNNNTAIGYRAMYNGGGSAGNNNVCIGVQAGYNMTTAHNNVLIGWKTGEDLTTGDGNVCIGYMAGETNLTTGSNQLWIANTNRADPLIYGEFDNEVLQFNTTKLGFHKATPVVQQAHIVDADGTLADITTKFNALLSYLEAYGLVASV